MKKIFLATVLLCTILSGCVKKGTCTPVSGSTSGSNFNLEFLFEADGVKVYRFQDGGRYVYFTNTKGEVSSSHVEGKVTVEDQTVCNR